MTAGVVSTISDEDLSGDHLAGRLGWPTFFNYAIALMFGLFACLSRVISLPLIVDTLLAWFTGTATMAMEPKGQKGGFGCKDLTTGVTLRTHLHTYFPIPIFLEISCWLFRCLFA